MLFYYGDKGISLVLPWIRLQASTSGKWVQSQVGELRSCMMHGTQKKKKKKMVTRAMDIKNRVSKGRKIGDTLDWCIRKASLGEGR